MEKVKNSREDGSNVRNYRRFVRGGKNHHRRTRALWVMMKDGLGPFMAGRSHLRHHTAPSLPKGVRFLIAHENLSIRKFIKGCLQSLGASTILEMIPTGNVLSALVREEGADVLVVNGEITEMREWNLVRSIRSHPKINNIKVIVVSGNPDKNSILAAIQAGVDDYIILPFSAAAFEDRIRTLFAKRWD